MYIVSNIAVIRESRISISTPAYQHQNHIDADALHSLDRMHTARIEVGGRPLEADFSAHAFQPLSATHPASKVQLQMHYGDGRVAIDVVRNR